jgi:hypothetical protein
MQIFFVLEKKLKKLLRAHPNYQIMQVVMQQSEVDIMKYLSREIVNLLGKKYQFDIEDASSYLSINTDRSECVNDEVKTATKTNIPLPFCGVINKNCCQGIRLNYGLYTQCTNAPCVFNKRFPVCATCNKQVEKNSNEEPNYGYINDRLEKGDKFRDPKGKAPVNYANIMEKMKISREEAETSAKKLGLTIPDEQFIIKKAARGRPKKDTTADDTASEASSVELKQPKKRGRPKKNKEVIDVDDIGSKLLEQLSDPIISNEVSNEDNQLDNEVDDSITSNNSGDEDDGVTVKPIKLDTKFKKIIEVDEQDDADYLIGSDNTLYHLTEHSVIGKWNPLSGTIDNV